MKSVIQLDYNNCYMCGATVGLEEHHIFTSSNRKKSEKYGYKVRLCSNHHRGSPDGIHHNRKFDLLLRRIAQEYFEETNTRQEFINLFGRNYLGLEVENE